MLLDQPYLSVYDRVDGVEVGKHPKVTRLLKGAFHDTPPLPCYTATWNVQLVLDYLKGLGTNTSLSLKQSPHKLCILLILTRSSRSADLAVQQIDRRRFSPEGVTFLQATLARQSRQSKTLSPILPSQ